jgi:hypothetical protein
MYLLSVVVHRADDRRRAQPRKPDIQWGGNLSGRRVTVVRLKVANGPSGWLPQHPIDGPYGVAVFREQTLHGAHPLSCGQFSISAY